MITFPTSPVDGDIHERWTWSDTDSAWQLTAASASGGTGGGSTTFAALTDAASVDLPALNTPLASALSGKQPLASVLTGTTASFTTELASKLDGIEAGATGDQDLSGYVPTSRTIAGHALSENVTLVSADISDAATSGTPDVLAKYDENGNLRAEDFYGGGSVMGVYIGTDSLSLFAWTLTTYGLLTAARAYSSPNASGTLALTSSTTGIPDALHNATISGTVAFSGTGLASMRTALAAATTTDATTARTLALADIGNYIRCTHASGCAITIPQQTTVAWPDGSIIYIRRATGAGAISLAGAGITYNDSAVASVTAGQSFALRKAATDSWDFI